MAKFDNAVIYHIYPLGYCGAEKDNAFGAPVSRILNVIPQIPVLKRQGYTAVYFGPVFSSTRHGYDTADYLTIDARLGTNADFAVVCNELHKAGLSVVLDGVFNHVGRDFWAFRDVREKRWQSEYKDWFLLRDGNSNYNDGFWYEGWEGHYDLVKLNLANPAVKDHIKYAISEWVKQFGIDGLRLDVAYCLDLNFLKELHWFCKGLDPDFWVMGETLHGDYRVWCNPEMCDSVTNYQSYKGLWSSFNAYNMFEIAHSISRQFGGEDWCQCRGMKLYTFLDNHDVTRIATQLTTKEHLKPLYTLLFTMPGIPGVYYGSEYGVTGDKKDGDDALRQPFELSRYDQNADLPKYISKLAYAHSIFNPLFEGSYAQVYLTNKQYAFSRTKDGETVYALINSEGRAVDFPPCGNGEYIDVLTGEHGVLNAPVNVPAFGAKIFVQPSEKYDRYKSAIDNADNIQPVKKPVIETITAECADPKIPEVTEAAAYIVHEENAVPLVHSVTIVNENVTDVLIVSDTDDDEPIDYFGLSFKKETVTEAKAEVKSEVTAEPTPEPISSPKPEIWNEAMFQLALKSKVEQSVREAVSAAIAREYANITEVVVNAVLAEFERFTKK
ncbi:MAG: maltodextrin glucosidase [Oscillospiraceae bacterium]|jgi:glycosidase|nr:maltodextrin glucosidase [Oscillospiraceae bacterium]